MSVQSHPGTPSTVESYLVRVDVGAARLEGQLAMPAEPRGVVLFVHGGESRCDSPQNKLAAETVREGVSVGTLLMNLLSPAEDAIDTQTATLRFDVALLASRVVGICDWLAANRRTHGLPIGLFGVSSGAAAALVAAAERPDEVAAVVSSGGSPDLATDVLRRVLAPTLLIASGDEPSLLGLNRRAADAMTNVHEVSLIPRAGQSLEEAEMRREVSRRAASWFARFLPAIDTRDEPRG